MINVGKIFIPRTKTKQVEVNLNPETRKIIVEHNNISEREVELQEESLNIEKEKLKTQDRVEISLSEYTKMKEELETLRNVKKAYMKLLTPVINLKEISETHKRKICDGKIETVRVNAYEDLDPYMMKKCLKVALYFTVEEDTF